MADQEALQRGRHERRGGEEGDEREGEECKRVEGGGEERQGGQVSMCTWQCYGSIATLQGVLHSISSFMRGSTSIQGWVLKHAESAFSFPRQQVLHPEASINSDSRCRKTRCPYNYHPCCLVVLMNTACYITRKLPCHAAFL